jgi:hypothetical protein
VRGLINWHTVRLYYDNTISNHFLSFVHLCCVIASSAPRMQRVSSKLSSFYSQQSLLRRSPCYGARVPLSRKKEKTLRPGSRALQCTAPRTVQHAVNAGHAATCMARMNGERQLRRRRPVRSDDGQPSIGRPRSSLPTRGPHEAGRGPPRRAAAGARRRHSLNEKKRRHY